MGDRQAHTMHPSTDPLPPPPTTTSQVETEAERRAEIPIVQLNPGGILNWKYKVRRCVENKKKNKKKTTSSEGVRAHSV